MATSCHGKKVTWAHNPSLVKQKSILQGTKCNKNSFPNRGTKNWITKRNISYRKAKRPPQDSETGQPTQISNLNRSVRNHFITLVTFTTMTVTNPRHRIPTLVIRIPQNTLWIIRVVTSLSWILCQNPKRNTVTQVSYFQGRIKPNPFSRAKEDPLSLSTTQGFPSQVSFPCSEFDGETSSKDQGYQSKANYEKSTSDPEFCCNSETQTAAKNSLDRNIANSSTIPTNMD